MARMTAAALLLAAAMVPAWPQTAPDAQLKQAGVCARCHVISVVEWGISRHQKADVVCASCHGASLGHVAPAARGGLTGSGSWPGRRWP